MDPKPIREKHHRLAFEHYIGFKRVAFTLCIKERIPVFQEEQIARETLSILEAQCRSISVRLWVAVCMPDHIHFLVEGCSAESDLYEIAVQFKQQTGWLFKKLNLGAVWQKDFYDHILRDEEDHENQVLYILNNPVRGGLALNWMQYPLKISSVLDLSKPIRL